MPTYHPRSSGARCRSGQNALNCERDTVTVLVAAGAQVISDGEGRDADIAELDELFGLRNAVVIGVLPEPKPRVDRVVGIDAAVTVLSPYSR